VAATIVSAGKPATMRGSYEIRQLRTTMAPT